MKWFKHYPFGSLFTSYLNFFRFVFFLSVRYDVGQGEWVRCNVHIQKMCHYPVFGLKEGTLYQFRVRAVNQAGAGRASKATEPILTTDPLENTRTMGNSLQSLTVELLSKML